MPRSRPIGVETSAKDQRARMAGAILLSCLLLPLIAAAAADSPNCRTVRFSDVGWTDITATTALTSRLLQALGYRPVTQILSIPVTYASIKNRQIDVYLGDWQPSMEEDRKPFLADGSVEVVRANLKGAKYTLAVPSYVAAAGVKDFADLHAYAERFKHKVIGIEPGNNGNRMIGTLIADNRFGLGDWTLVESSEQGMLSEVDRAIRRSDWIVFLAWSPHPMNLKYRIEYLSGGDDTFGASYGGATIYTDVRIGYLAECPNVGVLLRNLEFTPEIESQLMALILDDHLGGPEAASLFLAGHTALLDPWLAGVTTIDGKSAAEAVRRSLHTSALPVVADRLDEANNWVVGHKIPIGEWLNNARGLCDASRARFLRRSLRSAGIGDCLADRLPHANPGITAHRRFGGSRLSPSSFTGAHSVHSGRAAAHRQPGLLGAIDPDLRASLVFDFGVRACRHSHRHHRRAPAVGLQDS